MKRSTKSLALFLVLLILFSALEGCENANPSEMQSQDIQVLSDPESVTPLCVFLWSESYDESSDSWISVCGSGTYKAMTEPEQEIPTLQKQAPVRVKLPSNCRLTDITVYDTQFNEVELTEQSIRALNKLPAGTWYVSFSLTWEGKYIRQDKKYEKDCNGYLFLLTVSD